MDIEEAKKTIGNLVISLNELVKFCQDCPELLTEYEGQKQLKCQILKSKENKPYCVVDDYKKASGDEKSSSSDDLPF